MSFWSKLFGGMVGNTPKGRAAVSTAAESAIPNAEFSIEGDHTDKNRLLNEAAGKYGLNPGVHFSMFIKMYLTEDAKARWDHLIVSGVSGGGGKFLTIGEKNERKPAHYRLPADYEKALEAIGRYFQEQKRPASGPDQRH